MIPNAKGLVLREAQEKDGPGIIALISSVLNEFGEEICLGAGGAECDLVSIQTSYFDHGNVFWVMEDLAERKIVGTHAALVDQQDSACCILKRLYLHPDFRGTHCANALMQIAVDWAHQHRCCRVEFWSDTRFKRAHRFFEKFGFMPTGAIRTMNDSYAPYNERHYRLDLPGTAGSNRN